ncbi:TDT family transporter [Anoxynatronum buryatiense]|uniref:Exfoliative toxin A/B n=1 Tax=Anoxynatronum buryatiense TaxID=489973 RepID=A0AA46AHV9_9CLOT|nr:TDT family transporter [Anoxynatronum buryatiense]SMP43166.1 exfoliative toxin A/B [Anoxynatronum buryatiense]
MLLKKIPFPMAGLMLGMAGLGNLVVSYGAGYRYALGAVATLIMVLLIAKAFTDLAALREAFEQPPVASVLPTFSMGMAILSVYLRPFLPQGALVMWFLALLIHMVLLVIFTKKYVVSFKMMKVFPSWFIVYVGLACFSLTAPAMGQLAIGQALFWIAFAAYLILLPVVIFRVVKVRQIPDPALPSLAIFTAPSSLALAGYLNSFPEKNLVIVAFLTACTFISFIGVMLVMPRLLRLPFFPSFSAFTFPFVITGIALKGTNGYLSQAGVGIPTLGATIPIFEFWAVMMVLYVLWQYLQFLRKALMPAPARPQTEKAI